MYKTRTERLNKLQSAMRSQEQKLEDVDAAMKKITVRGRGIWERVGGCEGGVMEWEGVRREERVGEGERVWEERDGCRCNVKVYIHVHVCIWTSCMCKVKESNCLW